ncbi:MAG: ATP-binding protein, partial [candidate division WOR-3 bacterium]|nr:ATP-binding protein [candidate division WOR-3 bacterium]
TLESLREPLEDKKVRISRARGSEIFPCDFILIAAMNPCPCGYFGSKIKECVCKPSEIEKYQKRISGPIMDRIDLWVFVQNLPYEELSKASEERESEKIKNKVLKARDFAKKRNQKLKIDTKLNGRLSVKEINTIIKLKENVLKTLNNLSKNLNISPRMYHKIIRIARTIADLE